MQRDKSPTPNDYWRYAIRDFRKLGAELLLFLLGGNDGGIAELKTYRHIAKATLQLVRYPPLALASSSQKCPSDGYFSQWRFLGTTSSFVTRATAPVRSAPSKLRLQLVVAGMTACGPVDGRTDKPAWAVEVVWVHERTTDSLYHMVFDRVSKPQDWAEVAWIALIKAAVAAAGLLQKGGRSREVEFYEVLLVYQKYWEGCEVPFTAAHQMVLDRRHCADEAAKRFEEALEHSGVDFQWRRMRVAARTLENWSVAGVECPGFTSFASRAKTSGVFKTALRACALSARRGGASWYALPDHNAARARSGASRADKQRGPE